jgi:response regulator RpfG family c-di-GMP phosphodiesterase
MSKTKILYVDDEEINLMLFEANLESQFDVFTANSGIKGLEIIKGYPEIRVVISDMKMPLMNGIEFIKKASDIAPKVKFYILTGFEITTEIQQALNQGIIRKYFRKPFNMNEISREIDDALSNV